MADDYSKQYQSTANVISNLKEEIKRLEEKELDLKAFQNCI